MLSGHLSRAEIARTFRKRVQQSRMFAGCERVFAPAAKLNLNVIVMGLPRPSRFDHNRCDMGRSDDRYRVTDHCANNDPFGKF